MEDESTAKSISRRSMMKRIGAGTAVVWAAPVLTNLASPANAQFNYGTCTDCAVDGDNCGGQVACGNTGSCSCLRTSDGGCFCHEFSSCGALPTCTQQSDCQAGWACSLSCCSATDTDFFCHPPCGTNAGGAQAGPRSGGN